MQSPFVQKIIRKHYHHFDEDEKRNITIFIILDLMMVFVMGSWALGFVYYSGLRCALPLAVIFIVFPLLELFLPLDSANLDEKMTADEKNAKFYDWLLYMAIPIYLATFAYFLMAIPDTPFASFEFWCRVVTMGLIAAIFGFNIGHELSHRVHEPLPAFLGQILLLSVINLHFIPYHNAGHHRNVGKPSDPSTAKKGEWLYSFWFRSQLGGYFQAWHIENQRTRNEGHPAFSLHNKMVVYSLATIAFLTCLYFILGQPLFWRYLLVVLVSTCFLETILCAAKFCAWVIK